MSNTLEQIMDDLMSLSEKMKNEYSRPEPLWELFTPTPDMPYRVSLEVLTPEAIEPWGADARRLAASLVLTAHRLLDSQGSSSHATELLHTIGAELTKESE